ncbi:MAG: hypothetical protein K0R52_1059 [Alphaproteobacteria bacterium]|jgi:hypothetical protein|nr:hypothetical protein [Alphaproteobacteria bacterium]
MSIKSTALMASLLLILSSPVWADYSAPGADADDEIETAIAQTQMAPLLDFDRIKLPALSEEDAESSSSKSLLNIQERVQEALENQEITGLSPSWVSSSLIEDYKALELAKRIEFSPMGISKKNPSWLTRIEEALKKMGSPYESDFWSAHMLH